MDINARIWIVFLWVGVAYTIPVKRPNVLGSDDIIIKRNVVAIPKNKDASATASNTNTLFKPITDVVIRRKTESTSNGSDAKSKNTPVSITKRDGSGKTRDEKETFKGITALITAENKEPFSRKSDGVDYKPITNFVIKKDDSNTKVNTESSPNRDQPNQPADLAAFRVDGSQQSSISSDSLKHRENNINPAPHKSNILANRERNSINPAPPKPNVLTQKPGNTINTASKPNILTNKPADKIKLVPKLDISGNKMNPVPPGSNSKRSTKQQKPSEKSIKSYRYSSEDSSSWYDFDDWESSQDSSNNDDANSDKWDDSDWWDSDSSDSDYAGKSQDAPRARETHGAPGVHGKTGTPGGQGNTGAPGGQGNTGAPGGQIKTVVQGKSGVSDSAAKSGSGGGKGNTVKSNYKSKNRKRGSEENGDDIDKSKTRNIGNICSDSSDESGWWSSSSGEVYYSNNEGNKASQQYDSSTSEKSDDSEEWWQGNNRDTPDSSDSDNAGKLYGAPRAKGTHNENTKGSKSVDTINTIKTSNDSAILDSSGNDNRTDNDSSDNDRSESDDESDNDDSSESDDESDNDDRNENEDDGDNDDSSESDNTRNTSENDRVSGARGYGDRYTKKAETIRRPIILSDDDSSEWTHNESSDD